MHKKPQRFYFGTSVFGGLFDKEFNLPTQKLFDIVLSGEAICVFSNLTETELAKCPASSKKTLCRTTHATHRENF